MVFLKKHCGRSLTAWSLLALLLSSQAFAMTDEEQIRVKRKRAAAEAQKLLEACREDPELEGCEVFELENSGSNEEGSQEEADTPPMPE